MGFRRAVYCGPYSPTWPDPQPARRPGRRPDYNSLPPARCREAARREAFASGESPRWPRGEGGVLARAAAAAPERGEARAAPCERVGAGSRRGSSGCSAVPASAPRLAPVSRRACGVPVLADAASAEDSGRGDGGLGTAGPLRDPPGCRGPSGAGAPGRLVARVVLSAVARSGSWDGGGRRSLPSAGRCGAGGEVRTATEGPQPSAL